MLRSLLVSKVQYRPIVSDRFKLHETNEPAQFNPLNMVTYSLSSATNYLYGL